MAKYNPRMLRTDAGKRLSIATLRPGLGENGCDGVIVQPGENRLSWISRRIYGTGDRWRGISEPNGLEGKKYRIGDCLRLPPI